MITSTSNSQVKYIMQLQSKTKTRKEKGEFVVEGLKMVEEIPKEQFVKAYISESFEINNQNILSGLFFEWEVVKDGVFAQMSDTKTPQGILAIVKMKKHRVEDLLSTTPLVVVIENLQDPGNLGTIVRTSEGAGVTGVLMSPNTVDIYNPKTIRSTMGSIFRVPFLYAQDFYDSVKELKSHGVKIYAAHLDGENTYTQGEYRKPSAFLIGNEGNGLTIETTAMADQLIRIPMCGKVESLNAAIATTVLLYEAKRQRDI